MNRTYRKTSLATALLLAVSGAALANEKPATPTTDQTNQSATGSSVTAVPSEETATRGNTYEPSSSGTDSTAAASDVSAEKTEAFTTLDGNGDGYLTRAELRGDTQLTNEWTTLDNDSDERISSDEWAKYDRNKSEKDGSDRPQ